MYCGRDFDPSDTGENEVYTIDFVNDLAPNEALMSAVWTCAVVSGIDTAAATRISGAASVALSKSSQRITGLLPGVKYRLQAVAMTTFGNSVSLWSHVICQSPK